MQRIFYQWIKKESCSYHTLVIYNNNKLTTTAIIKGAFVSNSSQVTSNKFKTLKIKSMNVMGRSVSESHAMV